MCKNVIKICGGVWISIGHPHTNRKTSKHLHAHFYVYSNFNWAYYSIAAQDKKIDVAGTNFIAFVYDFYFKRGCNAFFC